MVLEGSRFLECLFLNWSNSAMTDNACIPFEHSRFKSTAADRDGYVERIAELHLLSVVPTSLTRNMYSNLHFARGNDGNYLR